MTIWNEEGWGGGIDVNDVLQIVLAARDTREESVYMHSIENLEMTKSIMEEIDQVTTIFLVTHYNRVVGEVEHFQLLDVKGKGENYG